jgi:surface antigen
MRSSLSILLLACFLSFLPVASHAQSFSDYNLLGPLGGRLTNHDLKAIDKAALPLLEDASLPIGTTRDWNNPQSGDQGTIKLLKRFEYTYEGAQLPCRQLRYHVQTKGNADPYNYMLNRCKASDGTWKIL